MDVYKTFLRGEGEALSKSFVEVCVTPVSEVCWYAACTKPCHEKRVAEHLRARDIALFLPLQPSKRLWRNGCHVTLERPLFPGYVFVHIPPNQRLRVLELSGVHSMVSNGRTPIPLSDEEISRLRVGLPLVNAEPHPLLTVGEAARICRGPLEGLTGILTRQKGNLRVVLTLDIIMKSVAVEVSVCDIVRIQQIPAPQLIALAAAN